MKRRVLITGATSGIGLALAERHASRDDLLLTGRMTEKDARQRIPATSAYVQADQTDPNGAAGRIVSAMADHGWKGVDLAFLNAAIGFVADPAEEPSGAIRTTLDVNITAQMLLAHALHPLLDAGRGRLVLIGSTARRAAPRFASYAASKAALNGFGRALAEEWRERITVQVIHPGPTASGMHAKAGFDPGRAERFFLPTSSMAAMIDRIAAGNRSASTTSYGRYLFGGYWTGMRR